MTDNQPSETEPSQTLTQKMAEWYFTPNKIERWRNGRMYELLGVRWYKDHMPIQENDRALRKKGIRPIFVLDSLESGLEEWEKRTRGFEKMHGVSGIILAVLTNPLIISGHYEIATMNTLLNVIINFYPVLTQRYNRARIYNILEKREGRK